MKSVDIDFFQKRGNHYLILMDPFSGLNMFQKMKKTAVKDMVAKLKKWFTLFGVTIMIRCDNAPPFSYKAFQACYDSYIITLNLTACITPRASGPRIGT